MTRAQRSTRSTRSTRPALGRGLDALFSPPDAGLDARSDAQPDAQPDAAGAGAQPVRRLPLDAIEPNPQQPRKTFGGAPAAELTQSVAEHGILQPLLVRPLAADRYQLVAGERRWRAARAAGLEHAPVVVVDTPDSDMLTLALVENLQREDLNPIDQAAAFQYLLDAGLSQAQIAQQVGKSRAAVANTVRLLQLPPALQEYVAEARLAEGHARALLAAPKAHRRRLAETALAKNLTVRQIEAAARKLHAAAQRADDAGRTEAEAKHTETGRAETERTDADAQRTDAAAAAASAAWRKQAADRLQRAYNTRAAVTQDSPSGGRITLRWYSQEQLEQLIAQLTDTAQLTEAAQPADTPGRITI